MKKLFIITAVCCSLQLSIGKNWGGGTCYAQGTWTQKADFGGTTRLQAVGFSIGDKGYIGTGYQNAGNTRDFWEWDQANDTWTQKADFGGTARTVATGFSIGTKGYIGTGFDELMEFKKDFWEWDQLNNIWIQKADFGGTARCYSIGFSIGTNGYIGCGQEDGFTNVMDVWEYNPGADTWIQKADFGAGVRSNAVGFSIGNKGYIGTGGDGSGVTKDFWEFDPFADTWTQKADVGSEFRFNSVGFSIGNKGYVGTGEVAPTYVQSKEFWEWDQAGNTWSQQTDFGGAPRQQAVGFSIGDKGYIGTGLDTGFMSIGDFWEFSTDSIISGGCSVPTGLYSTHTIGTATLHWNVVAEAISYKVRFKVAGTIPWTKRPTNINSKKLRKLAHNTNYVWQVRSICALENSAWSSDQTFTTGPMKLAAEELISFEVFPDPFESSASISFSLQEDSRVQLNLYDVAGRKIQTVLDDNLAAGNHLMTLNRNQLKAGLYFLQMRMEDQDEAGQVIVITKKVMIVQ